MTDIYTRNRLINWLVIILVILNLMLLTTIWYPRLVPTKNKVSESTKRNKPHKIRFSDRVLRYLQRELNFTQEQVDKFMQLEKEHFSKTDQVWHQLDKLRKDAMDQLLEAVPDTTEVEKLIVEMGQKMAEHERMVFYHFLDILELCNAEQKQKFRSLLREIIHKFCPLKDAPIPPPDMREPPDHKHGPGIPMELEEHLRWLSFELGLTDSQVEKIRPFVKSALEKLEKMPGDFGFKSNEEQRGAKDHQMLQWEDSQIEALLTDEQKIQYQELKKARDRGPGHCPPPPPH